MVQAIAKNGAVNLESTIGITEDVAEAIKSQAKEVKALCKDLHATHSLSANEYGTHVSMLGRSLDGTFDPHAEAERLAEDHKQLIGHLTKWLFGEGQHKEAELHDENDDDEPMIIGLVIPAIIL